jgi:hypothetical protein
MKDLNSSYFLPHHYKRIGWAIIVIHLLLIAIAYILHDLMGMRNFLGGLEYLLFPLLHYTVMIGLTIVISSREEKEDEMIRLIRLKSFQYGLYLTVFVSLVLFILSIAGNHDLRLSQLIGIGGINATLIYIVVIYQFKLYRLKYDEE